ncbi:acyl-CoA N-acyltransferase [Phascolomyces articulosus]|uniref:Acyl-CoA N-acyltransferase n=1 Tax=Phascolomyces articulosus TaxID=60185 RepID=A0AAD5K2F8_9FUNG|nr:acyl-CoA N-acyltransferase [Phascolomyces articulosus]
MSETMKELVYEPATLTDLDIIADIETQSYHPDEAASKEQIANRMQYANECDPNLFYGAWTLDTNNNNKKDKVAGFVCTTLGSTPLVTDESMKEHDPKGKVVYLHSVCVNPEIRRQKVATRLMQHWIELLKQSKKYDRIALISRENLIGLYESVGFKYLQKSEVVHGPDPWFDMVIDL